MTLPLPPCARGLPGHGGVWLPNVPESKPGALDNGFSCEACGAVVWRRPPRRILEARDVADFRARTADAFRRARKDALYLGYDASAYTEEACELYVMERLVEVWGYR